ncbi:uncharacterized protein LOC131018756 [Salvia miltiorrhiza]|uniref:uncharacterized protein LOC131018756 n=1 Tax=Salvia miltiorrhiza TaxID=226208 RepID=UPI0025AC75F7|nr:uncharacterized protein LOC131018756 [Salvia miltiorrhiza]
MNIISWNCRGLGQPLAIPILSELVRVHRPQFLFLCETLSLRHRMEEIRSRLNFEGCFTIDCVGRSGGLYMIWKTSASCIYLILGDKRGRVDHSSWLLNGFRAAVIDCGISDIPFIRYLFTWCREIGTNNFVEEHLDRGMATASWKSLFPGANLTPLTVPMSDHVPLLLKCQIVFSSVNNRRFRFENKWCLELELPNVVRDCWTNLHGVNILERHMVVSDSISTWARHLYHDERRIKVRLKQEISMLMGRTDPCSICKFNRFRQDLANIFLREKTHWRQRAKQHWLKEGDCNTKFFFAMASARRKKNTIHKLQKDDG